MDDEAHQTSVYRLGDILAIGISGQATTGNASEIARRIISLISEHKPAKLLIDCTGLVGRLGTFDTYYHVRDYPRDTYRPGKTAILENPENEEVYSFHQTAAANVGFELHYFTRMEDALKWLAASPAG
jgi:hypothetical protein